MSSLNPGGTRSTHDRRVFVAADVERVCRDAKRAEIDKPNNSLAGGEHAHSREVQRRLRQAARRARDKSV